MLNCNMFNYEIDGDLYFYIIIKPGVFLSINLL